MPAEWTFMRYLSGEGEGVGRVMTVKSRGPWIYLFSRRYQNIAYVELDSTERVRLIYMACCSYLHIFSNLDCTHREIGRTREAGV